MFANILGFQKRPFLFTTTTQRFPPERPAPPRLDAVIFSIIEGLSPDHDTPGIPFVDMGFDDNRNDVLFGRYLKSYSISHLPFLAQTVNACQSLPSTKKKTSRWKCSNMWGESSPSQAKNPKTATKVLKHLVFLVFFQSSRTFVFSMLSNSKRAFGSISTRSLDWRMLVLGTTIGSIPFFCTASKTL